MADSVLSFVIPVRNDAVRLRRCLASIRNDASGIAAEIIVADNGSSDDSAEAAREFGATVISLPNRRVSEVRNTAVLSTSTDILAFVDADHTLADGWTRAAMAALTDPAVSAVGADYHAPPDGTWVQKMYDNLRARAPQPRQTDWLPSGNLVVRRAAFNRARGFDATLESCEDVDLSRRLREDGGTLIATDALRSVHHGDPRTLRALFLAELWRGRDNLRVSLRERLTPRSAVGLAMTLAHLAALAAMVLGLVLLPVGGGRLALVGGAVALLVIAARTVRLLTRIPASERSLRHLPQAVLVAATYDTARALALVARVGHDVRRKAGR